MLCLLLKASLEPYDYIYIIFPFCSLTASNKIRFSKSISSILLPEFENNVNQMLEQEKSHNHETSWQNFVNRMIKRFQSELTIDARKTSDLSFPLIKNSNLNFSINESSFPLLISIKKSFIKIKNGSKKDGSIFERVKRLFTSELYCLSEVQKGWLDKQGSFELVRAEWVRCPWLLA